jgi:protein-L-isoaspartate(D-aspartate) O-methyltransferase
VIIVTEALDPRPGDKVLEVGTGSGYHAALISEIVTHGGANGHVYTIEIVPELVEMAKRNLSDAGYIDKVTVIQGDGFIGYSRKAPYDRIFSTAFAPKLPKPLVDQLKVNGVLVLPIQTFTQVGKIEVICAVKKVGDDKLLIEYH